MVSPQVGFIGLGAMGQGMALSVLRAQFPLKVFDIRAEACAEAVRLGATAADTPGKCAAGVDVLVLCVLNAGQVEKVLFDGPGAVFGGEGSSFKGVIVVSATVSPIFSETLATRLSGYGAQLIDAPMSGGSIRASQGDLTFMAAGEPAAFEKAKPVIEAMGKIFYMGEKPGLGSSMKMVNQVLAGTNNVTAAEGLALAAKLGLDTRRVFDIISTAAGNSFMFQNRMPHALDNDPTPHSTLDIWIKDLGIVVDEAKRLGFPVPMTGQALQQYLAGHALGCGGLDDSFVVKVYETLTGVTVARKRPAEDASEPASKRPHLEEPVGMVEVYDEPLHKLVLRNEYCNALFVDFSPGSSTLMHRHSEDSLYFFFNTTKVQNRIYGEDVVLDEVKEEEVRFGTHKAKPLIHRICCCGPKNQTCVDAEILKSPPVTLKGDWDLPPMHTLVKVREKARVYQLTIPAGGEVSCLYPFYALVVVSTNGPVTLTRHSEGGEAHTWTQHFKTGDVIWREGPLRLTQKNTGTHTFKCFIAEWR